ncbi:predicted protein, partial [Arabidopsis lyrata subsp. lyrata]
VHRARVGDKREVVVKVQSPGVEKLMMIDIINLQIHAENEKQIGYEFDFEREANAMEKLQLTLMGEPSIFLVVP